MAEPYVKQFHLPNGNSLTTVVLDEQEFFELVDSLAGVFNIADPANPERADDNLIQKLKEARHIPMMSKGTKTVFVYDKYGIESQLASFIVRGHGPELLQQLIG